ncbi:MAG: hypothetical protein AAF578_00235 [Pseudomonadota bacterium]
MSDQDWAQAAWEAAGQAAAERAEKMPTEQDAINQMHEAYKRLKELGWKGAEYCPKDNSLFASCHPTSTGIAVTSYMGDWPKGTYWIYEAEDMWPANPVLFRLMTQEETEYRQDD